MSHQEILISSSPNWWAIILVKRILAETKWALSILIFSECFENLITTVSSYHHLGHSSSISGECSVSDHKVGVHCGLRPDHLDLGEVSHDLVPQPRVPLLSLGLPARPGGRMARVWPLLQGQEVVNGLLPRACRRGGVILQVILEGLVHAPATTKGVENLC